MAPSASDAELSPAVAALAPAPAPGVLDARVLGAEIAGIVARHGGMAAKARPEIIEFLRRSLDGARAEAKAVLSARGGRASAALLSANVDQLIRVLYDVAVRHFYPIDNPADTERMAIIATGGYGRGLLAPFSDIDLLFLLPYKQTPWGESVVEWMLYALWDLKLKVGHATRTVEQSIKLSLADMTIRTAILDARLIHGEEPLFHELLRRFEADVMAGTSRAFSEAKLAERDQRHARAGASRYRVEPNIKDGKGGLRDLHTLHWLAKYSGGRMADTQPIREPAFTAEELATFRRCEEFLWAVRCHLHFTTGRPEDRLTFDLQPTLAALCGYTERGGLKAVERFMKHYFLVAKDVGDLTAVLCSALEVAQAMSLPTGIGTLLNPMSWRTRRRLRRRTDFRIVNGRLTVADDTVFARDPANLLRIFVQADQTGTLLHPDAMRLMRRSLRLIDERLRQDPEANRIFLSLLTGPSCDTTLRRLNEAGVLGRFLPPFGKVVSMMQYNAYHHFTVDEHLIQTVGQLAAIERGELAGELPLSTRIVSSIQSRRALYVAALLHDIGKGREEDHSIYGARIARQLCPRLGLEPAETETVAWLIEQHLTMSNAAQRRDISDPKTIRDFAAVVQSPERLKLLLLLTVADIRAVGPGTWNGWKGQLLRTLYAETEPIVAGGHTVADQKQRIAAAQEALRTALADRPKDEIEAFIARHYPDYWLKTDTRRQIEHAGLLRRAAASGATLATEVKSDAFTAVTELTLLAPNHPRLLAIFAGACASAGANIVGAHISTTRDGLALDTFLLQREHDEADERRRADRIRQTIERLLEGKLRLDKLMETRRPLERRLKSFNVPPEVIIDNALSDVVTVIEVAGLDRPGLLFDLTSTLSDLNLDITSAHITTFGEKAVDVFYVTDLTGRKIEAAARQKAIRERLLSVLAGTPPAAPAGTARTNLAGEAQGAPPVR